MNALSMLRSRRILILTTLLALLALLATPARAAETRGGDSIVIGPDEVVNGDLYVTANAVTIDGIVNGDLIAVASMVTINGTVKGDLLAAAQTVMINGTVADDARVAGQAILLTPAARVAGDLVGGGLSMEGQVGSVIQGDLLLGAYQALLAGTIGQRVQGGVDRMELRGAVGGDVDLAVSGDTDAAVTPLSPAGQVPIPIVRPNLTLAETATIGGKLIYHSTRDATISPAAQVACGVVFDRSEPAATPVRAAPQIWIGYARRLIGLVLIGLLLLWLAPTWTRRMADTLQAQPLPSLGWGALTFGALFVLIAGLLIVVITLASLFGWLTLGGLAGMTISTGLLGIAALVIGAIGFCSYIAQGIVAFVIGRLLLQRALPAWSEHQAAALVVGLVLYVALSAIPWLGGLVGLAIVLLALGALWLWGKSAIGNARPTSPPMVGLQTA